MLVLLLLLLGVVLVVVVVVVVLVVVVVVRMSYTSFDAYSLFGRWRTLSQSLITCYKLQANVAPTKHRNKLAFSKVFKSI